MGAPKKKDRPDPSRIGRWLLVQVNNLDPARAAAAAEITSRWDVTNGWFSYPKVLRTLRREDSAYLTGAESLAGDYLDQFGEEAITEVGAVGAVPIDRVQCSQCRREAVPGSDRCGRHGGQYLTPEDAKAISEYTAARVLAATDKAYRALEELLDEGRSEMVRLQAANSVLDRAGITAVQRFEIDVNGGADAIEYLKERIAQTRETMEKQQQIESEAVLEAEVVEGD